MSQPNLDRIDDQSLVNTLNRLPLYDLVHQLGVNRHMKVWQSYLLANVSELTLAIGGEALELGRNSKLWHEFQNDVRQFEGGWYQTLHWSYIGTANWLNMEQCQWIKDMFPMITRLNIMLDFESIPEEYHELTMMQLVDLLHFYAQRARHDHDHVDPPRNLTLSTLKLWVRAQLYYERRHGQWNSMLRNTFGQRLWNALVPMTDMRSLWLDLAEVLPAYANPLNAEQELEIVVKNQETFLNMGQLEEFRYTSDLICPFMLLELRMARIGTLQRISILYTQSYEWWINEINNYPLDFRSRFREISVILHEPAINQLEQFCSTFNSLTRFKAYLAVNGPRFLQLFRALHQVPLLFVLHVVIVQDSLFTREDVAAIGRDRPVPLASLQILVIEMRLNLHSCSTISVAPIFPGNQPQVRRMLPGGQQAQLHPQFPVPSLVCFEMQVREGACQTCPHRRHNACIRTEVIRWFSSIQMAVVRYIHLNNPALNVSANLAQPVPWPEELHHILQ